MKIVLYVFSLLTTIIVQAQESRDITYIRNHAILAVQEMHLYKIPASITLAQGLLETGGGQSRLAEQANNHFGIKCKSEVEWPASKPRIYHNDDAIGECFRSYQSVAESYRDHSEFIALRPYYKALFTLPTTDYKAWAHGLKKSGYATDPSYASKLIARIEKYNLDQFDHISEDEVYAKLYLLYNNENDQKLAKNSSKDKVITETTVLTKETPKEKVITKTSIKEDENKNRYEEVKVSTIAKNEESNRPSISIETRKKNPALRIKRHPNNIAYVVAEAGETLGTIGKLYKKTPSDLAKFNEIKLGSQLKEGQIVFFDKKKSKGSQQTYRVNEGDDMYTISQKFGIKINNLYKLNGMNPGDQPKAGQSINLKTKRKA